MTTTAPRPVDALTAELGRLTTEHDPLVATQLGLHERDAELGELTVEALDAQERALSALRARVEATTVEGVDDTLDRRGLLAILDNRLADLRLRRPLARNPLAAPQAASGGILALLLWDHVAGREASVAGRLGALPRYLAQARALLEPAVVPPRWAELAVASCRANAVFLRDVVPGVFPSVAEVASTAAEAMLAYADWVATAVQPVAAGSFALGEEGLRELLTRVHLVDASPQEVAARGRRLLERYDALLVEAAGGGDWRAELERIRADHPDADGLLPAYREELERLRAFCFAHDLVTDPDAPAELDATPQFLRALWGYAAYMTTGPFDERRRGRLWVTPPASPEALADHSHAAIRAITAHEGYPGHHLQLTSVNRVASLARRMRGGTTLMVEGWGLYVEELMHEVGYYDADARLVQLVMSQWRAARIVADMGLHLGELSVDDAVDLLERCAGITRATATSEVDRYTMMPTQPFTYLYGAEEIRRVRDGWRTRTGGSLRAFHDTLLGYGHLPPSLVAEALLA